MATHSALNDLPDEILLRILSFLEVNDLLQLGRTCHGLRDLSIDPVLHLERLHAASHLVSRALAIRPTRTSISPPNAWIWLSRTNVLSRQISKSLNKIRLSHSLERRPSAQDLVNRAILPASCTSYMSVVSPVLIQSQKAIQKQRLKDGLGRKLEHRPSVTSLVSLNILPAECASRNISPALVAKRRQVMRESLKDGLRAWIERRGIRAQKARADELEFAERQTVKSLAQRYAAQKLAIEMEASMSRIERRAQPRFGREVEIARRKEERRGGLPTRAHVLGLRRFWEGVIRAAS